MSWLISKAMMKDYANSHSSPAQVGAFSEGNYLDGEQYAPLNVMPTQRQFWRNDKTMDVLNRSPFGLTWKPLTEGHGEELLTWFREGFRARTSARQERERESQEQEADYGNNLLGSFAKYDPDTCSWKTHQFSLLGGLTLYSETWPRWGLMQNGECWELSMPAHLIGVKESGLWRSPAAQEPGISISRLETRTGEPVGSMCRHYDKLTGRMAQIGLTQQVQARMWPTPTVCGNHNRKGVTKTSGDGLATAVKKWPTPLARDSRTVKGGARSKNALGTEPLITVAAESEQKTYGRLNPEWVEKLMGWPDGWTCTNHISHVKMCFWIMGFTREEETRKSEVLRVLRKGYAAEEIQREIGRHVCISEAAILLSQLCEYQGRIDEAWIFLSCAEALEGEMRSLRLPEGASGAPHRPRYTEQQPKQYSNTMQALSRLLAYNGATHWQDGSWENGLPRIVDEISFMVDRLKALGNGQVPRVAAMAWRILSNKC